MSTVVNFKEDNIRDNLVEALKKEGWMMQKEYDWDLDKEVSLDYKWEAYKPEGGFIELQFMSNKDPENFSHIKVNAKDSYDKDSVMFMIDRNFIKELHISNHKLFILMMHPFSDTESYLELS